MYAVLRLRDDTSVLEQTTPEELERLLTVLFRQERFYEGTLENAYESGLLVRILRRTARLEAALADMLADRTRVFTRDTWSPYLP